MDRFDDMKAFIERMRTEFNDKLDELDRHNREREREKQKRCNCINAPRFRPHSLDLTDDEKEDIRKFYVNCPKGYEIDHIIPLSKGGRHHVTNLQYLTKSQNASKGTRLDWKKEDMSKPRYVIWDTETNSFI